MIITRKTPPASEPITKAEVKLRCRLDGGTTEDSDIDMWISTARQYVEEITWRSLITQTWELYLHSFPCRIRVPRAPLISVSAITYVDTDGATQTLNSSLYTVDKDSEPGLIYPIYGQIWPNVRCVEKSVKVTFDAGYGAAGNVPAPIKQAMFLLIGLMYENREEATPLKLENIPYGVKALLSPYRMRSL